ncbi:MULTISPECIES: DNA-binding protein [Bacillus amyloliquefaciens group]|uniref:DNA-binding protein n=1 Tax=Bacillus amyloliquefaciens group TaxID=1938374 RepID=UPI0006A8942B|nr:MULTISPECIES: DNA-binding protein [Bacillus amyloliquefaciens group]MCR4365412.1 DNA-binding protein [Bacillus amyloliquefaciens]MCV3202283.1 DNA-binding protein [Bacillus velezensis]MDP1497139.1 DNA-binding protein [Bacillus velezensis]MDW0355800.1 DNA-binding protein [Bacillus velezensis]MEE1861716.1 DNA-binding protein [Bacillus velezensis]
MDKFIFNDVEELREFLDNEVITTSEAIEIIGCSRQNLKQLVDYKTLVPIKTTNRDRLFLRKDIEGYKKKR